MNASLLILLGVAGSLVLGISLLVAACWPSGPASENVSDRAESTSLTRYWSRRRVTRVFLAGIGFLLLNSWWLALAAMLFVKFVILREDT